uniref:Uncharacterized protein n=1 Tax=Glossina morsitans morsitans TaxID=37546 RepID=A0A1B0F9Y1_GLOMM
MTKQKPSVQLRSERLNGMKLILVQVLVLNP